MPFALCDFPSKVFGKSVISFPSLVCVFTSIFRSFERKICLVLIRKMYLFIIIFAVDLQTEFFFVSSRDYRLSFSKKEKCLTCFSSAEREEP